MKRHTETLLYAGLVIISLVALGLFAVLPRHSLITALVYKGF
jgi:hypothetical protein